MRTIDTSVNTQSQRPRKRCPALTRRESAKLIAAGDAITPQRFPKMSLAALAFARRMQESPHVQAAMRDLADK